MVIIWEMEQTLLAKKGMREFSRIMEIFYILIWVVVTWLCTYVKNVTDLLFKIYVCYMYIISQNILTKKCI